MSFRHGLVQPPGKLLAAALVAAGLLWAPGCSSRSQERGAAASPKGQFAETEVRDTTVRNVTEAAVEYTIRPIFSSLGTLQRTLAPGAIDRFPGEAAYDIEFTNGVETKLYRLDKGTPHSFRLDNQGLLELYQGAHGREDVPDLAPFVPTPMPVVEKMLEMAEITAADVVYDLGCGDGRIVITAARTYGARGVGIDIVPERIRDSRAGAEEAGVAGRVEFLQEDATAVDVSPATVVALYLLPESNLLLRPKLEAGLKPGTRVVSHNYSIEGWADKLVASETLADEKGTEHTVYLYRR